MSQTPPYSKLENEAANFSGESPVLGAPPAYSETPLETLKSGFEAPHPGSYPSPMPPPVPHQQPYPQMAPMPQAPPTQVVVTQSPPVNVMVGGAMLPPGVCSVCRVGKIKDTASCCTWLWCLLLLPVGILPGLLVFCCCCRRPKCNHCGFTV